MFILNRYGVLVRRFVAVMQWSVNRFSTAPHLFLSLVAITVVI